MDDLQDVTYQYQPLVEADQEFRILQLLHLPESSQEPLQCRMKHASLKEVKRMEENKFPPPTELLYEAISYCWGDPTPSSVIYLDGKRFYLPVSSEKALRRMAFPDQNRNVYLDAVCINQADSAERSSQVLFMADIFRHAQGTLALLGDGDQYTARAFASLRLLHQELQKVQRQFIKDNGRLANVNEFDYPRTCFDTVVDEESFHVLFQSDWFQ